MGWYKDEELWRTFYDYMFNENSFNLAHKQVPQLLSLLDHPISSVLDLGCGPGRHSLAFSQMGYDVVGVDTSEFLLSKAKKRSQQLNLSPQFICSDMLEFEPQKKVDLAINMFNSFGYFDSQEKNQSFINTTYSNLNDNGVFIIDSVGKETLARNIEAVHLTEFDNGDIKIERPLLIDNMQIFSNEWILIKGDSVFRREYQHYIYTPNELTQMCLNAGFVYTEIYGSLSGDEYDLNSDRLIVVAHK